MEEKTVFADLICSYDEGLSYVNMTECERYGITWGCDKDCPVLQRKECELQEEVEEKLRDVLIE